MRESEGLFYALIQNSQDVITILGTEGTIVYESPSVERILGYSPSELVGTNACRRIHPDDLSDVRGAFTRALRTQDAPLSVTFRFLHKDGSWRVLESEGSNQMHNTAIGGIVVNSRDITENVQIEERLRESEEKYRLLFEKESDAIVLCDPTTLKILDVNDAFVKLYGYSREELRDVQATDLSAEPALTIASIKKTSAEGTDFVPTRRHVKKDGTVFPVEISSGSFTWRGHGVVCAMFRDITKRKQTEDALRESKERFRNLVETTSDWVWEVDQTGAYTYASPRVRTLLGYAPEEVIGKTPFDFMPDDEAQRISEIFQSLARDKKPFENLENTNCHREGRFVVLETSGVPFFDSHGELRGYRGIDRDITERKLVEESLKASLREKETLLRELYHRTKNNMQVISNLIDLQVLSINDEQMVTLFRETQGRIRTMALVHEKLYQSGDLSNLNLKDYIRDLARAVLDGYQLGSERISLKLELESIAVSIDTATPCGLILNELMSNSLKHAFPGNRRGEISIVLRESEKGEIHFHYSDNGIGLPGDFDFKNTKSLGLTLVKTLSEKQLHGTIELRTDHPTEVLIKFRELSCVGRIKDN